MQALMWVNYYMECVVGVNGNVGFGRVGEWLWVMWVLVWLVVGCGW